MKNEKRSIHFIGFLLLLAAGAIGFSAGCESQPEFFDESNSFNHECALEGTCECLVTDDCQGATICLDGRCTSPNLPSDIDINDGVKGSGGSEGIGLGGGSGTDPGNDSCETRTPTPEQCNGFDDDCDGEIDEDFRDEEGQLSSREHCGRCGLDCNLLFANLATQDGEVTSDATSCSANGDSFTCRPSRCAEDFGLLNDADGNPAVCLPVVAANCQICANSSECSGGAGHECISLGTEGSYCFQRCDAGFSSSCSGAVGEQDCCPGGFQCDDVAGEKLCQPLGASCLCGPDLEGVARVCTATGDGGNTTCLGSETCSETSTGVFTFGNCDTSANVDVCDGKDNDCSGTTDDLYTLAGQYTLQEHCGACGNNCTTRWDPIIDHAVGRCEATAGPNCVIESCTSTVVGGGTLCTENSDCSSDTASTACDPGLGQCAQPCIESSECTDSCFDGWCTTTCSTTEECETSYGSGSVCSGGHCGRTYDWRDRDGFTLNGCECAATGPDIPRIFPAYPTSAGLAAIDRNCDGVEGNVARALFVSDGANGVGTLTDPFGSIQQAMDVFDAVNHEHILVSTGTYLERLDIPAGVHVYGGYSADFSQRDLILFRTEVLAGEPNWPAAPESIGVINALDITEPTTFAGFTIQGYDVSTSTSSAGKASYAVYIKGSSSDFVFVNNEVVGGRGGDGRAGGAGASGVAGGNGAPGLNSSECANPDCSIAGESQLGGSAGTNLSCPAASGCSGMEADGASSQSADSPAPGCNYGTGGDRPSYSGSLAQYCKYDCQVSGVSTLHGDPGGSGIDGTPGGGGTGCSGALGSLISSQWSGAVGSPGSTGTPGSGGDGGAAGGAVINQKSASCTVLNRVGDLGGSGGGGAAGGCGGQSGAVGQSGGASFAVFIASGAEGTFLTLSANKLIRGIGGDGGDGGAGGSGGTGGKGGKGGLLTTISWCGGKGGAGGDGGFGGDGGGGGGGCGGPSFAISGALIPTANFSSANSFPVGDATNTGGLPGEGGLAPRATPGTSGQAGGFQNVYAY